MTTQLVAQLRLRLVDDVSGEARRIESAMRLATSGASASVEQLRLKQLEATNAARTLAARLRQLQSSSTATEAEIREVSVALVRARENAAGFAREARELAIAERSAAAEASKMAASVQGASSTVAQGSRRMAAGADDVAKASKQQARGMAESVNMATEMALGFGGLNPQVRELSIGLAMGGNNAVVMANSLGIWGIALGLATGVLPTLITQLVKGSDGMGDLDERTRSAADSVAELRSQLRQMREEQERERAAERGELDVEGQQHELDVTRARASAAHGAVQAEARRFFLDRADAPQLQAVAEEAALSGRDWREVFQEHLDRGVQFGPTLEEMGDTAGAKAQLRQAMAGQLPALIREQRTLEDQIPEREQALETARRRQREAEERDAVRSAPQRIREQLQDLATVSGLTDAQRTQFLAAAEKGKALPEGLVSALGPQAARARELAGSLTAAERAAAQSRLDEAATENLVLGLPEASPLPVREQVQRARRRPAALPTTPTPMPSVGLSPESLASLERLAAPRRVEVDVRVSDDRVRVTTRDVDAETADITGGQQ